MTEPTARTPHTVTLAWTPDQNFGRVSCLNGRVPVSVVLGRLWAGEPHDEVATDFVLSREEVGVLAVLADELRPATVMPPSVPVAVTAIWRARLVALAEDVDWHLDAHAVVERLRAITREMASVEREALVGDRRPVRREAS